MIKKVVIEPGCIGCGLCESIVPEVFEVKDVSRVDQTVDCERYAQKIRQAASSCPVGVIRIEE